MVARHGTPGRRLVTTAGAPAAVGMENLSKTLGAIQVLNSVTLVVEPGQMVALLGPSGSGKTTLINLIAGFERPDAGDIRIDGRSIIGLPPHRRDVGVVFQSYALFPHMTVAENLAYPLRRRGMASADIAQSIARTLELVRLGGFADRWVQQLSGGQQQRIALGRALIARPAVLLMDEPMAALDKSLRDDLQLEIRTLQRNLGVTVLYITHDQREAMALADRIAVLNGGRIEQADAPEVLFTAPRTPFVAKFIGGATLFRGTATVEGDQWWLAADGLRLPGAWPLPPPQPRPEAELAVPPAAVRLVHAGQTAAWSIPARVASITFGGETSTMHLALANGAPLVVRIFGPVRAHDGEEIRITWDPAAAPLFAQSP